MAKTSLDRSPVPSRAPSRAKSGASSSAPSGAKSGATPKRHATGGTARMQYPKGFSKIDIPSDKVVQRLQNIPIFEALKADINALNEIINITSYVQVTADTTIIEEGSISDEMFIVYDGAVEIKKLTRAGDTYTVVKLDADQNVFFGEMALIDNDRRSATVTTVVESQFLVICSDDFKKLGSGSPHIALPVVSAISRILSTRLRKTTSDMLTIFDALVQELSEN